MSKVCFVLIFVMLLGVFCEKGQEEKENTLFSYYKGAVESGGFVNFISGKDVESYTQQIMNNDKDKDGIPVGYKRVKFPKKFLETAEKQKGDPVTLSLCNSENKITVFWNRTVTGCDGQPTLDGCDKIVKWKPEIFHSGDPGVFGQVQIYYFPEGLQQDNENKNLPWVAVANIVLGDNTAFPSCKYWQETSRFTTGQIPDETIEDPQMAECQGLAAPGYQLKTLCEKK